MLTVSDLLDVIVEPRYDTNTILAAGALQLTYFTIPLGQGQSNFGAAGVQKNLSDTNMDLAAQLPAGYNFVLKGFRIQPAYTINATDLRQWSSGAFMVFTIGSKPYLRVPLDTIPAGMGPMGFGGATVDTVNRAVSWGAPLLANAYNITQKPLLLQQTQNFNVVLSWTAVVAVTSVVPNQAAAGLPVRVWMDGYLKRVVQ